MLGMNNTIHNGPHVTAREHNGSVQYGPLQTLVSTKIIHKGIIEGQSKLLSSIIYQYQIS